MYNKFVNDLSNWLNEKFLAWEKSTGRRQTITAFARYLGVKQPSLVRWMAGDHPPTGDNLTRLAKKLGYDIYDILGMARPDAGEEELVRQYQSLPPNLTQEQKDKLVAETKEFMRKWAEEHGFSKRSD